MASAVALVVAAGRGERLGSDGPKAFVPLAGRPMLAWSVAALQAVPAVTRIVVALPEGAVAPAGCVGVVGGAERSHSVRAAMAAAGSAAGSDVVLVHDAARPLLTPALVEACLAALEADGGCDAAIAASRVTDTIKQADGRGRVTATLDRSVLWSIQTPQVFRRAALERALARTDAALAAATDDAMLVEQDGGLVRIVEAPAENLKVTTPVDLAVAALLLRGRSG